MIFVIFASIQSELPVCPSTPPSNQTYQDGAIIKVDHYFLADNILVHCRMN